MEKLNLPLNKTLRSPLFHRFFDQRGLLFVASLLLLASLSACRGGGSGTGSGANGGGTTAGTTGGTTGGTGGGTGGTTGGTTGGGTGGSTPTGGVNPGTTFDSRPPLPAPDPNLTNQLDAKLEILTPSPDKTLRAFFNGNGILNTKRAATLNLTTKNITSFQIISEAGGIQMATYYLKSPSGTTLITSESNAPEKTTAVDISPNVNALPYPAIGLDFEKLGKDAGVVDGKYVHLLFVNANVGTQYTQRALGKNDPFPNQGLLRVNVFFVGTTAQRADYRDGAARAFDIWQSIYAAKGISLQVRTFDVTSATGVLPSPFVGSSFYSAVLTTTPKVQDLALNVFIGASISQDGTDNLGNLFDEGVLGIAAAIPGPASVTVKSGVAISINAHAGRDNVLTSEEIAILGETMAHESGHFLGLFHPVQDNNDNGQYVESDPLTDTPSCTTDAACIANGLAQNLMFPVTVKGIPQQRDLTTLQGKTLNNAVLVD